MGKAGRPEAGAHTQHDSIPGQCLQSLLPSHAYTDPGVLKAHLTFRMCVLFCSRRFLCPSLVWTALIPRKWEENPPPATQHSPQQRKRECGGAGATPPAQATMLIPVFPLLFPSPSHRSTRTHRHTRTHGHACICARTHHGACLCTCVHAREDVFMCTACMHVYMAHLYTHIRRA